MTGTQRSSTYSRSRYKLPRPMINAPQKAVKQAPQAKQTQPKQAPVQATVQNDPDAESITAPAVAPKPTQADPWAANMKDNK